LYVWKNIFAKSTNLVNGRFGEYGAAIKCGNVSMQNFMDGYTYFFNNTILQENNDGFLGIGIGNHDQSQLTKHFVSRNNILQARAGDAILSTSEANEDLSYDFDLLSDTLPVA